MNYEISIWYTSKQVIIILCDEHVKEEKWLKYKVKEHAKTKCLKTKININI